MYLCILHWYTDTRSDTDTFISVLQKHRHLERKEGISAFLSQPHYSENNPTIHRQKLSPWSNGRQYSFLQLAPFPESPANKVLYEELLQNNWYRRLHTPQTHGRTASGSLKNHVKVAIGKSCQGRNKRTCYVRLHVPMGKKWAIISNFAMYHTIPTVVTPDFLCLIKIGYGYKLQTQFTITRKSW